MKKDLTIGSEKLVQEQISCDIAKPEVEESCRILVSLQQQAALADKDALATLLEGDVLLRGVPACKKALAIGSRASPKLQISMGATIVEMIAASWALTRAFANMVDEQFLKWQVSALSYVEAASVEEKPEHLLAFSGGQDPRFFWCYEQLASLHSLSRDLSTTWGKHHDTEAAAPTDECCLLIPMRAVMLRIFQQLGLHEGNQFKPSNIKALRI